MLHVFHYNSEWQFRCTDFVIGRWAVEVARINNGLNLENSFVSSLSLISCFSHLRQISQKVIFSLETLSAILYMFLSSLGVLGIQPTFFFSSMIRPHLWYLLLGILNPTKMFSVNNCHLHSCCQDLWYSYCSCWKFILYESVLLYISWQVGHEVIRVRTDGRTILQ